MKLYLAKPDLMYFDQYNEMMTEWTASNTRIAPWFLDTPIATLEDFAKFIRMLDDAEHGIVDKRFSATSSYKVLLGVYESNIDSWKTVEKCGGILENRSRLPGETEDIRRYWIKIED